MKLQKIKNFLNKDVKEFNTTILSLACILFLAIAGIISYKINNSYALFSDTVNSSKTIRIHYQAQTLISQTDSYVGYYADTDGDNKEDGVIFFDYAVGQNAGRWNPSGNTYYDSAGEYQAVPSKQVETKYRLIGENNNIVQKVGKGEDRFYVIALKDLAADGTNTAELGSVQWYWDKDSSSVVSLSEVSNNFETGKANTEVIKNKLSGNTNNFASALTNNGWFVPSKDELLVCLSNLGITKDNYSNISLANNVNISFARYPCASSLSTTIRVWYADLSAGLADYSVAGWFHVRLATTF